MYRHHIYACVQEIITSTKFKAISRYCDAKLHTSICTDVDVMDIAQILQAQMPIVKSLLVLKKKHKLIAPK